MDRHDFELRQLQAALAEARRIKEENAALRKLLADNGIRNVPESGRPSATTSNGQSIGVTERSGKEEKVALFRSLFRGREDVYAVRTKFRSGEWGYVPAAIRDWKAISATDTALRRKVDRKTRKLLPLTDETLRAHLEGRQTVGVYPLLQDETCWFLAADFDKDSWQEDASAFLETSRELNVSAALERSRSGSGGHVWIFFECAVAASMARALGSLILTRAMERRHQLGMDSYDRLFPNQDTMPKGGFGNLIALPLQWVPRQSDNSVFVDSNFKPYSDQWEFLAGLQRMTSDHLERLVSEAMGKEEVLGVRIGQGEDSDEIEPWTLATSKGWPSKPIEGTFPKRVVVVRCNLLYVEKDGLPPAMLNQLLRLAAFQNPEYYKAQTMRLSTYGKPRIISCGEEVARHIVLPRGCLTETSALLAAHGITMEARDERSEGTPVDVEFIGHLRRTQQEAAERLSEHDEGVFCAPTAFGKTVVAAWLIGSRKVSTLVLVHRQHLLDQWHERLTMFLDRSIQPIGRFGGGRADLSRRVDIAMVQSLYHQGAVKDFVTEYGQVIVDECHHISAFTFERVMRQVRAKYIVGLTATPTRKDGHHPIVYMQCGPMRVNITTRTMVKATSFEHKVIFRYTEFRLPSGLSDVTVQQVYAALVSDFARNEMIASDLLKVLAAGRSPLLLTGRKEHLDVFAAKLRSATDHVFVLKGGMSKKERRTIAEILSAVPDDEPRVIVATGSYIGEGFDDARLDTLFLAMPISWKGTLQQYVGRLHREHDNKRVVQVYDYVDANVPMLARMYQRRRKGYDSIGYAVEQGDAYDSRLTRSLLDFG